MVDGIVDLGELAASQGIVAVCDMGNIDSVDYYDYYVEATEKGFQTGSRECALHMGSDKKES